MTNAATVANASNTIRWRPRSATPTALRRSSPSTRDKSAQPPPWTQERPILGPTRGGQLHRRPLRILGAGARWNRRQQFLYRNEARHDPKQSRDPRVCQEGSEQERERDPQDHGGQRERNVPIRRPPTSGKTPRNDQQREEQSDQPSDTDDAGVGKELQELVVEVGVVDLCPHAAEDLIRRVEARTEKRPSRKRGDRSSPQRPAIVFRDGARHVRDDRQAGSGRGWFACRLIRPSAR